MRNVIASIALAGIGLALSASTQVLAEQALQASTSSVSAQDVATRALTALRRGEDATARDSKLAAYRECLEMARRAVTLDEGNADAHYALFACDGRIEMVEGAVPNPLNLLRVSRELDRALQLNPNHSDALAARGGLYRQLPWLLGGNLDKAVEYLNRSLAIDPESPTVLIELAQTYRDKGQPDRAVPLLEQAMKVAEYQRKQRPLREARDLLQQTQGHTEGRNLLVQ